MKDLKTLNVLFAFAFAVLLMTSCKDDTEFVEGGDVDFNIALKVADQDFKTGDVYTIGGTAVQFDMASFYIGGIKFTADDNTTTDVTDKYLLVNSSATNYPVIGDLKDGVYNKVDFFIGVNDTENAQTEEDFTTRSASDPLAVQDPAMHWNWNAGYKFLRIDGMVDTDGDGTPETANAFHIGSNPFRENLSFSIPEKVDNNTLEFTFDLAELFSNVDLATELDTHTGNNPELARKIVDNYSKALNLK